MRKYYLKGEPKESIQINLFYRTPQKEKIRLEEAPSVSEGVWHYYDKVQDILHVMSMDEQLRNKQKYAIVNTKRDEANAKGRMRDFWGIRA